MPVGPFSGRGVGWPQKAASPSPVFPFPPSCTGSWGAAARDRKAVFPWTCAWAPPCPCLAPASFQLFRARGGRLETPLMRPETVPENAGHVPACPYAAGTPCAGAVTSPRPLLLSSVRWWPQWLHPDSLQGSRAALASPSPPEVWRSRLGATHEGSLTRGWEQGDTAAPGVRLSPLPGAAAALSSAGC